MVPFFTLNAPDSSPYFSINRPLLKILIFGVLKYIFYLEHTFSKSNQLLIMLTVLIICQDNKIRFIYFNLNHVRSTKYV